MRDYGVGVARDGGPTYRNGLRDWPRISTRDFEKRYGGASTRKLLFI
jgi:hypothetical protein